MNPAAPFHFETLRAIPFGRHLEYHAVIDSTNDQAKRRVADPDCPLPLLVLAARRQRPNP